MGEPREGLRLERLLALTGASETAVDAWADLVVKFWGEEKRWILPELAHRMESFAREERRRLTREKKILATEYLAREVAMLVFRSISHDAREVETLDQAREVFRNLVRTAILGVLILPPADLPERRRK